jgi:hypothetical protein
MSTENPMSLSASSSLRAIVKSWQALALALTSDYEVMRDDRVKARALRQCADELSAALDAHQEEENQSLREGSSQPTRTPEATPKALDCPCGLSDEPWHWPRGGVCKVGAEMPLKGER